MKKVRIAVILFLSVITGIYYSNGCSTSSSTVSGDTVGDTVVVHETSSLPTIDITGIDIISPPSGSINKSTEPQVGDPSSAGCMATKFFKLNEFDALKQTELSKCFIKKTQENASQLTIPAITDNSTSSYGYYQFSVGDTTLEQTGIKDFRVRLANVESSSSNTLKIDVCQSSDGSSYARTNQIEFTGNLASKTWSGTEISHNIQNVDASYCKVGQCYFTKAEFSIVMNSADDLKNTFDWDNVKSVSIQGYKGRNPSTSDITSETAFDDAFSMNFQYDPADATLGASKYTMSDAYNSPSDSIGSAIYVIYNANGGASQISHDNGQGTYAATQAFNPTQDPPKITDSSALSYYNDVVNATLPSTDLEEGVKQAVTFTNSWDCEAPTGVSFTEISGSAFDYSECEHMVSTLSKPTVEAINSCFGNVSLAGEYAVTTRTPADCPGSATYLFTGSGPAYSAGTELNLLQFIYQNAYCSGAVVGTTACSSCDVMSVEGTIAFYDCNGCYYQLLKR